MGARKVGVVVGVMVKLAAAGLGADAVAVRETGFNVEAGVLGLLVVLVLVLVLPLLLGGRVSRGGVLATLREMKREGVVRLFVVVGCKGGKARNAGA